MPHHRPPSDTSDFIEGWRCPLCLYTMYQQVVVRTDRRSEYRTEFFECGRCSNMFRDPDKYARLGIPVRRWANDVGPKTLAEAHHYWREALEKKG